MDALLHNVVALSLDAAPWLLLGLVLAGLIRALLPTDLAQRWLGGNGAWPITKAALIGAPIPICSCGVVPTALSLRRAGASKGSTLSFLIATPETGVDSVAVTYALMGPFMAVARPLASILTAIGVGLSVGAVERRERGQAPAAGAPGSPCCRKTQAAAAAVETGPGNLMSGLRYAFSDLYDNIVVWLLIGLAVAGAVVTFVPPSLLAEAGSGLLAKVVMFLAGIPMYICATASTPLAASLLLAGVSPGTVLVFLLAGPATNLGTIGIVRREFGGPVAAAYLAGLAVFSIGAGIAVDGLISILSVDIAAQLAEGRHLFPHWFRVSAALVLLGAAVRPVREPLFDWLSRADGQRRSA
jgi:uncharacterized membrane protein YraQ (UPF0718 family)